MKTVFSCFLGVYFKSTVSVVCLIIMFLFRSISGGRVRSVHANDNESRISGVNAFQPAEHLGLNQQGSTGGQKQTTIRTVTDSPKIVSKTKVTQVKSNNNSKSGNQMPNMMQNGFMSNMGGNGNSMSMSSNDGKMSSAQQELPGGGSSKTSVMTMGR